MIKWLLKKIILLFFRNHAFVSFQAFAEIYNSVFSEEHPSTLKFSKWKDIMLETSGTGMKIASRFQLF